MSRYQIKVLDGDLSDLIHELSLRATGPAEGVVLSRPGLRESYVEVFSAVKAVLQKHVRGFHVCGCSKHCDLESRPSEMRTPAAAPQSFEGLPVGSFLIHPSRIHRYVLSLEVPLREFAKELEVAIFRILERHPEAGRSRKVLFRWIRENVLVVLGKYVYCCPQCNRGDDLCEIGVCTEFDPWKAVAPRDPEKVAGDAA